MLRQHFVHAKLYNIKWAAFVPECELFVYTYIQVIILCHNRIKRGRQNNNHYIHKCKLVMVKLKVKAQSELLKFNVCKHAYFLGLIIIIIVYRI